MKDKFVQKIPVVRFYKYLGIYFDDCLDFKKELETRIAKSKKLENSQWIL